MFIVLTPDYHYHSHYYNYCHSYIFFTVCKLPNASAGTISGCKVDCCEGDFCNAAVCISGLLASFVLVLMAMFQNLFPEA